jgi:toxin CcdB
MAQFDYYANTDKDNNRTYPFIVDVQDALLDGLNSKIVIPLTPLSDLEKSYPKNLCPEITIEGKAYALLTHQMASVSMRTLSHCEGSLAHIRSEIISAIDFLFTGI